MEPPPPPPPPLSSTTTITSQIGYPDSLDSSPHSHSTTDTWDEPLQPLPGTKIRLMCSYGGHIVPRPHNKSLCYLGGDTRIVVVDRHVFLSNLFLRLSQTLLIDNRSFTLKYQLPNEDLDSLISVITDEDLENMMDEYDRISSSSSFKPSRLRLFLFPSKPDSSSSIGSILESSKSENWFVAALNGSSETDDQIDSLGNKFKQFKQVQDVHSLPDSPMLETNSSFGSTSSASSISNLHPIRVHVEDQRVGLDEQFSENREESFVVLSSSPSTLPTTITAVTVAHSENPNRALANYERSKQEEMFRFWKPSEGIARDNSAPNAISSVKPVFYQDPDDQKRDASNPNYRISTKQVQNSGFVMPQQLDQQHNHINPHFFNTGTHYVHHNPSGPDPISSYYPMYQQQEQQYHHQVDQHYPMYFVPTRQTQPYNLPMTTNVGDVASIPSTRDPTNPLVHGPSDLVQQQYLGYHQMPHLSQIISTSVAFPTDANYGYEFMDPAHARMYYTQPPITALPH